MALTEAVGDTMLTVEIVAPRRASTAHRLKGLMARVKAAFDAAL
jgi:hypothetical protein